METVKCDLCGSDHYSKKYDIDISENNPRYYRFSRNIPQKEKMTGIHHLVECNNCGLMYANPRFSTDELNLVYSSEKVIGGEWKNFWYLFDSKLPDVFETAERKTSYNPNTYQWKFDIIKKYVSKSSENIKILDIGCGNGKFVHDANERGYTAVGIDMSPDRVEKGKELYGLNDDQIRCINVDEFSADEKFDIITLWDVIEHVESPTKLLNSIKKISHKDTIVMMLTMATDSLTYKLYKKDWMYINPPQHLNYFSHATMKKMFEKCNFNLVGIEMDDSKSKNIVHLMARMAVGAINQFFFRIYMKKKLTRFLFRPFQNGITDERMLVRLENLYPVKYTGRYHDNFVYIGKSNN